MAFAKELFALCSMRAFDIHPVSAACICGFFVVYGERRL